MRREQKVTRIVEYSPSRDDPLPSATANALLKLETAFNLRIVGVESYRDGNGGRSVKDAQISPASSGKAPRTARGERTLRKILDAARDEFGERGFSESSIVGITQRAGVALGTFYTYFDSKEAVFQALVRDMSAQVRDHVAPASGIRRYARRRTRCARILPVVRTRASRRLSHHRRGRVRRPPRVSRTL